MKLKGKNLEKLPADKKKRMEKTLSKMEANRQKDTVRLRDKLNSKINEFLKNWRLGNVPLNLQNNVCEVVEYLWTISPPSSIFLLMFSLFPSPQSIVKL